MREALDFKRMITEGAERWREVGRTLDATRQLVDSAADDPVLLVN